jgi:hypothetical protein
MISGRQVGDCYKINSPKQLCAWGKTVFISKKTVIFSFLTKNTMSFQKKNTALETVIS